MENLVLVKQPFTTHTIRFQDCDPHGHLNNARYLDYMINAREDHLISFYDFDMFKLAKEEKKGWVVSKNEILYKQPAMVMEQVSIRSQLLEFSPKHVKVETVMYDMEQKNIKSLLWSVMIHFDLKTQKVIEHNQEMEDLLKNIIFPIKMNKIEERHNELTFEN